MEERQEAAIVCRCNQNSERVRAHLYEREFRAKPVSRVDGAVNAGAHAVNSCGALDTVSRTRAVPPDERDMHLGRERPSPTGPWGEEGGMAEGVAHAPDASFALADICAGCDTGGTNRRPMHHCELAR